jgi:hypothetical protein
MGRVKDYNTFLMENKLLSNIASKQMTRILDPDYESKAKVKTQAEVESSFGNDEKGNPMGVWDFWKWDDKKNGFVATSPTFSGEVTLKEIDNEGDVTRIYEVTSGTNNGLKGNFTWESTTAGSKYPKFGEPADKKWSDVLGPDENFLKTFVSPQVRWASNISEIDGVKLKKVGLNGVYEIEYEDKFQFFGNVRIYYSENQEDPFVNSFYSYEVKDGPNKGAKGKGFQIFTEKQNSAKIGIYNPFSDGDVALKVIQYPAISHSDRQKNELIIANSIKGGNGIYPDQLIFFNTSDLSSIKGPTKELFDSLNFEYGLIPEYNANKGLTAMKESFGAGNKILGKIEKSKLPSTKIYGLQKTSAPSQYTGNDFPSLDGIETTECYISSYQGHPLILYTVEAKKKDSPSFDNKGVGTYGNRFFSGIFYDREKNIASKVRGEWYYDYLLDEIGIIYAYGVNDKKEIKKISNNMMWVEPIKTAAEIEKARIEKARKAKFDAEVIRSRHKDIGGF